MLFPFPKYIQLYPTVRCNQSCSFCFNDNSTNAPDLSYEKALRLLDIVTAHGIAEIDIMGGEPSLLHWIPGFIASAVEQGIGINISTNGSNIEFIGSLCDTDNAKLNIGVSLEGSTEEKHNRLTGSSHFSPAVQSIKKLIMLRRNPIVKTVLNKTTIDDIQNIINLLRAMGVRRYYLIHMDLMSSAARLAGEIFSYTDFTGFYEIIKNENPDMEVFSVHASCFSRSSVPEKARCAGGVLKISVTPDGSVFPCSLLHRFAEFNLGNIFDNHFKHIWMNPKLNYFRKFQGNMCATESCTNRPSCTGGCPAHGLYHYRNTDATDIRCSLQKSILR